MTETSTDSRRVTFGLIPGAGGDAWYWHRLVLELEVRGHRAVPVDLPAEDDTAGLTDYVEVIVEALGDAGQVVIVAQSMGGLAAPLVCERRPVELVVLVNAMIPSPKESGAAWWEATGQPAARAHQAAIEGRTAPGEVDPMEDFLHDLPPDLLAEALRRGQPTQSSAPFADPHPLAAWPDVPTRVIAGRDDRFFPAPFQRHIAEQRLGIVPDEIPGGHLLALANPTGLAAQLHAAWSAVANPHSGTSAAQIQTRGGDPMSRLPDDVRALLERPNLAHVATVMADGMPHVVPTWIGTVDDHVVFLTGPGSQKARNLASEPRVSVSVADHDEPTWMAHIRGRVSRRLEGDEAWAIIDQLAQVYLGVPYPRGMDRVVYLVTPERAVAHRIG